VLYPVSTQSRAVLFGQQYKVLLRPAVCLLQSQGTDLLGYVPEKPTTVPFDQSYATGSDDLPLDKAPLAKVVNETAPEQIHIALAGEHAVCSPSYQVLRFFKRSIACGLDLCRLICHLDVLQQLLLITPYHNSGLWSQCRVALWLLQ